MPLRFKWGADLVAPQYVGEHFLVAGTTGSGKSVLINMLMKSALERGANARAMVYDPKQDVLPLLYGCVGDVDRIQVLHPFDLRGCAWDLAADIDGPVSARQLATILVPQEQVSPSGSSSFFDEAVRDLLTGVLLAFINCPKYPNPAETWTFRDVLLTLLYPSYLRHILSLDETREGEPFPISSRLRETYLNGDARTNNNIRASINAKLSIFEPVAAVWHWAQKKQDQVFSLTKWLAEGSRGILVLGNDEASRAAIDAINQAIFKRTTELLLARRESSKQEKEQGENLTWFFLDEVREAGRLDGLSRLLTKGRSKGASVVLGFQDIDGLRAAYGDEVANEICGQCSNIAILKLSSPSTAEWACELFGRRLAEGTSHSSDKNAEGATRGTARTEEERPYLYSADLLYLPKTSDTNGLTGYFKASYRTEDEDPLEQIPWYDYIETSRPQAHPQASSNINRLYSAHWPRPVPQHYLKPWDSEDWARLGFEGEPPSLVPEPTPPPEGPTTDGLIHLALRKFLTGAATVPPSGGGHTATDAERSTLLRNFRKGNSR